jgi:hypothetical protein
MQDLRYTKKIRAKRLHIHKSLRNVCTTFLGKEQNPEAQDNCDPISVVDPDPQCHEKAFKGIVSRKFAMLLLVPLES